MTQYIVISSLNGLWILMDFNEGAFPKREVQNMELLSEGEVILVVDDLSEMAVMVKEYLEGENLATFIACSLGEMYQAFREKKIALVLLDIGLPDGDGLEVLPTLVAEHQDLSIIMMTAVKDLETALTCMRQGADDYLTKPVRFVELLATIQKVLEKRRLKINNRHYQRAIEQAQFRLQLTHELSLKMNTALFSQVDLDEILQAVLVGITAQEGLQFNRAFLALFDETGKVLQGRIAIGPGTREGGNHIWQSIRELDLDLHDLLTSSNILASDTEVNRIVKAIQVKATDEEHLLIRAVRTRKSIHVEHGRCDYPVQVELLGLLQEESFVVVPLFSSSRSLGVIIADHFITGTTITVERIKALESFASQGSLAIEHCHLYQNMERKIHELEAMTQELENNKNLLVEAERYSAVGQVASQLAHNIRNPVTAIVGTARLLSRKTSDPELLKFLTMMMEESEKIETIIEDLFNFVEKVQPQMVKGSLASVVNKALLLHSADLKKQKIKYKFVAPDIDFGLIIDEMLMQKALVHLIRNSIDAMPDGGELLITIEVMESEVQLTIVDTGPGIFKLYLDQVADPFYTTKTIGAGIGLTFVKRIVEDHQGTLRIEAEQNRGTRAIIILPRL